MHRMVFYISLIATCSLGEEFLKCSAVGKSNGKCFKDFYPDQEAQESNPLSPYENYEPYEEVPVDQPQPPYGTDLNYHPSSPHSEHNHFAQGSEYDFGYSVHDDITGDQKFHRESKHDNVVHGTYSLIEPDGSKRTVVYTADDVHGFTATVYRDYVGIVDKQFDYAPNINEGESPTPNFPQYNTGAPTLGNAAHSQINFPLPTAAQSIQTHPEVSNIHLAPLNPNFGSNIYEQVSKLQLQQNVQTFLESYRTGMNFNSPTSESSNIDVSNQLHEILGHQSIVNSLTEDLHHSTHSFPNDDILVTTKDDLKSTLPPKLDYMLNPLGQQLLSELVENRNTAIPDQIVGASAITPIHSYNLSNPFSSTVSYGPIHSPINSNYSEQNVDNPHPTQNPTSERNAQKSTPSAENTDSNSSSVVERPHHDGVTTPVPILNSLSSSPRLNTVTYEEFPLLAHISPTYSRRYARHYA